MNAVIVTTAGDAVELPPYQDGDRLAVDTQLRVHCLAFHGLPSVQLRGQT